MLFSLQVTKPSSFRGLQAILICLVFLPPFSLLCTTSDSGSLLPESQQTLFKKLKNNLRSRGGLLSLETLP